MPNDNYVDYDKKLDYIKENSSYASRVDILSEELVEATHEAQKLARIERGEQPVANNIDKSKIVEKLFGELCDVAVGLYGMGWGPESFTVNNVLVKKKIDRWYNRLKLKEMEGETNND